MNGIRLSDLVERLGGQLIGNADLEVTGIAPLEHANANSITFLSNPKLRKKACETQAAAIIIRNCDVEFIQQSSFLGTLIVVDNPYVFFAKSAQWFAEQNRRRTSAGIHLSAVVDPSAQIAASAVIGPFVCIEADVVVEENVQIDAGSFIGYASKIGADSHIHANVTVHHDCRIGKRAIFYSGAVIGSDGFGFANESGRWIKIPQTGGVLIGDDVEVGANTCIVGVAGSAVIGRYCTFGGAAMILGHLTIADNVHVSSGSLVSRSIAEPGQYTGFYPLAKNADWEKSAAIVRNLDGMRDKLRALEKTVQRLVDAGHRSTSEDN